MGFRIQWAVRVANKMSVDLRHAICEILRGIAYDAKRLSDEYYSELVRFGFVHTGKWYISQEKIANLSIDEITELASRMINDKDVGLTDDFEIIALTNVLCHLDASPTTIAHIVTAATCDYNFDADTFMVRFARSIMDLYHECPSIAMCIPHIIAPFLECLQHDEMTIDSQHKLMKIYEVIKTCGAFIVAGKFNIMDSHDDNPPEEIKIADAQTGITCEDFLNICTYIDEMINHRFDDTHLMKFRLRLRILVNSSILSVDRSEDITTHLIVFNWCDASSD